MVWAQDGMRALLADQKRTGKVIISPQHVHAASMLAFLPRDAINLPALHGGLYFYAHEYRDEIERIQGAPAVPLPRPVPNLRAKDLPSARLWAKPAPDAPLGVHAWLALRRHHDIAPIGALAKMAELCGFGSGWNGYRFVFDRPESWVVFQLLAHSGLQNALSPPEQAAVDRLLKHIGKKIQLLPLDVQRDGRMLLESQVLHWPAVDREWGLQWLWHVPYESHQHEVVKRLGCIWSKTHGGWAVRAGHDPLEIADKVLKACNRRAIFLLPDDGQHHLTPHFPADVASVRLEQLAGAYAAAARKVISLPGVEATAQIEASPEVVEAVFNVPYALTQVRKQLGRFPGSRFCPERKCWVVAISRLNVGGLPKLRDIQWQCAPEEVLDGVDLPGFGVLTLFDDGCVQMSTPYHEGLVSDIRRHIDPLDKGWDGEQRVWKFRMAEPRVPALLADIVRKFELDVTLPDGARHSGPAAVDAMHDVGDQLIARFNDSYKADSTYEVNGLKLPPFPFQRAGIAYVARNGSCLIGDDCGLGKTIQGIGSLLDHDAFPALIICPAIARLTWRLEWLKFTDRVSENDILILGLDEKCERALEEMMIGKQVIICGFDGLKRYHELLRTFSFKAAVVDESHYIKNPNSLRGRLTREILVDGDMPLRILLSATPYTDRPSEMINQLAAIGKLDVMGGPEYIQKLDNIREDRRADHYARFNRRLRSTCMIRRIKAEVMDDMPDVLVQMVPCELTGNYEKAEISFAEMMLRSVLDSLGDTSLSELQGQAAANDAQVLVSTLVKKHLSKAKQATVSMHIAEIARLRRELGEEKIRSVTLWIRNFFRSVATEKLVVFARHIVVQKALYEACQEAGIESVALTGDMSAEQRKHAEMEFQEGPARCCIASLGAARENITLTAANHVFFAEQEYSGGAMIQARDRLIRIGQQAATVNVYFAIMANSLDGNMSRSIANKMAMITEGLGDGHKQAALSREDALGSIADIFLRHSGRVAKLVSEYEPE